MEIKSEVQDNIWVLSISGMLDTTNAQQVENTIFSLEMNGAKGLILDLFELTYLSSSGIRVFIRAHHHMKENKTLLAFASLQPFVYETLNMANLTGSFSIYPDLATAKDAIA